MDRQSEDRQPIGEWTSSVLFQRPYWYGFLLGWATAPDQTPENLKRAIDALDEPSVRPPKLAYALLAGYYKIRDIILGDQLPSFLNDAKTGHKEEDIHARDWIAFTLNRLPWERERALRLLDAALVEALSELEDVEKALEKPTDNSSDSRWNVRRFIDYRWRVNKAGLRTKDQMQLASWIETTPLLADEIPRHMYSYSLVQDTVDYEVRHRALQLKLALIAWHLAHGKYPETLGKLVPEYFERLPRDPYDDGPFHYLPHGYTRDNPEIPDDATIRTTPVLWSVGPYNQRADSTKYERLVDEDGETEDVFWGRDEYVFPLPKLPVEPAS